MSTWIGLGQILLCRGALAGYGVHGEIEMCDLRENENTDTIIQNITTVPMTQITDPAKEYHHFSLGSSLC